MCQFKAVLSMVEIALKDIIRPGGGRGLDFVVPDELRKRTGIDHGEKKE